MCQVVEEFMDLEVSWDEEMSPNIYESIGEDYSFNAPHGNVFGELFSKIITLITSNDGVE